MPTMSPPAPLVAPAAVDIVMSEVVQKYAALHPGKACVTTADEGDWTWADAREEMFRAANAMRAMGIEPGHRVGIMLPNGLDWLRAWWGTICLGGIVVAINPALRGEALRHVLDDSEPQVVFAVGDLVDRIEDCGSQVRILDPVTLHNGDAIAPAVEPIQIWDTAWIGYTSGTTGPAKGAVMTHAQMARTASPPEFGAAADDTLLIYTPMFHIGGCIYGMSAWLLGATLALRSHFVADQWLEMVRKSGATRSILVASMTPTLMATPEHPDDADNPLHTTVMIPVTADADLLRKRFGIKTVVAGYGMTELGLALSHQWPGEITKPASAGKPKPGVEVRLVDEHDIPVPPGSPGELIMRSDRPWEICSEYLNQPELTAKTWRNGWFHTGDQFYCDDEGFYFFVDRATDSIRRRGENISSFEVERAVISHPDVIDVACVGVANQTSNDAEVKVFIVVREADAFDPADLIEHCRTRLHYFAIPTFVEVIDELPKTQATARHLKFKLRQMGNSARTWDRRAAGIVIKRDY
ncbi:AMP-binding protein [[Mycobacterium] vasticus]|uniref:AMP-binding protein n=1 Tax=[Mycobacterium] vasticus TaxID=2875777 RepID=A0ABU5YZM4_9MYCO|nr:AMP-binding protein [Mycolicibacter sp. MYC017]MEB3070291.1 AMP-binding protein [Mycolicibacter sp. MYC017]